MCSWRYFESAQNRCCTFTRTDGVWRTTTSEAAAAAAMVAAARVKRQDCPGEPPSGARRAIARGGVGNPRHAAPTVSPNCRSRQFPNSRSFRGTSRSSPPFRLSILSRVLHPSELGGNEAAFPLMARASVDTSGVACDRALGIAWR